MKFFVQIKLLLWKNWILRKRNKFRTLTEIVWPLLMILVVILLHLLGEKTTMPNCHMKAKAMPTAGEILFLQTFFCTLNNTCDSEKNASIDCFNSSLISILGDALKEAFNLTRPNSFKQGKEVDNEEDKFPLQLDNWVKDFFIIENLIETIKKQQSKAWSPENGSFFKNYSITYTCNSIKNSLFDNIGKNEINRYRDINYSSDVKLLSRVKRKIYLAGIHNSFHQLLNKKMVDAKIKFKSPLDELKIIDYILCGPNVPKLAEQINSLITSGRKKSRQSEETTNPGSSNYVLEKFVWENDTTEFCNKLMGELESTYASRVVFRLFKPLIRGKLIYTPDAPVINRVMARINETLQHVKTMIDLIKKVNENSDDSEDWNLEDIINKYKNEELFVREIVETSVGKAFLKYFENETDTEGDEDDIEYKVNKFKQILDERKEIWGNLLSNYNNTSSFAKLIPFLECIDLDRVIAVRDEKLAVEEALKWLNRERLWGLIVFNDISPDAEELPPSLTYKIRTGIERTTDTNQVRDRIFVPKVRRNVIYDLREITGGFAYLQNMIEGELIREYTGRKTVPGIYLKQMPYPCHVYDTFRDVITRTFPLFMVVSWIYVFCMVSKKIVIEKEILFKGTLRIFGVTTTQHWISWFVDAIVPMLFITTILSVLIVECNLVPNSSIFVIWLFLSAFTLPTITLAFLVSTMFSKASIAMAVSGMIYFLLYLPYPPIQNFAEIINPYFKVCSCLISNVAFGLGCTWIANMEETGVGAQLDKLYFSPIPGNPITMGLIIEMLLIDSLIYLLLALYFDKILPSNDFVKKHWYFCVTKSFWRGDSGKGRKVSQHVVTEQIERDPRYFEPEPVGIPIGIEVINLTKDYGKSKKKKRVVNNLNINFFEGQITSFLGHNGAGKTTAISMMIGLTPITKGTVRIYGVDVKANPNEAVKDVGICRQENVLLDDLTVEEHFKLFAKLKNHSSEEVENDMRQLIEDLHLGHKATKPVKTLSGGMKRKVCVAMAFIGGSRTVFLDEPTAGIDPYSRRSIWELLFKYKKGRTIILTTHFLDEADLLGDRIAIISAGELKCCGSSLFLKSQLGKGYYLTIESTIRSNKIGRKAKGLQKDLDFSPQVQELNNLIKKVIPSAEFSEEIGSEIVFILPSQIKANDYNTLFTKLEQNKERLNFSSYGITYTSLEEVFMRVLLEAEEKRRKKVETPTVEPSEIPTDGTQSAEIQELKKIDTKSNVTKRPLNVNTRKVLKEHFLALLIKRFIHHRRNFKIVLIEIFLPTLFMAIALALAKTLPTTSDMPPLEIDMSAYTPTNLFYTNDIPQDPVLSSYEEGLLGPYGFGTECVLHPEKCSLKNILKGSLVNNVSGVRMEDSKSCYCPKGFFECEENQNYVKPPSSKMSSGDRLYNLTGMNLTNWLIANEYEYSADRLGGISFGHFSPFTGISVEELLHLFSFEKFVKILEKFIVEYNILISPDVFTLLLMTMTCNKTFGEELFKDRDLSDNIIIWFNNRGWISNIAMMNGVTNLVLRASLPNGTDVSKYSIRLINHPLPITKRQLEDQIELQTNIALLCALSVIWALSFIPAMYAVYLVEESTSGLKHLQIVSGISKIVYWCCNLIWDLISYFISILAIVFLYFLFQMNAFVGKESIAGFFVLLNSYGFVNITFVYLISFMFTVPSSGFIFVACWNILWGVTTLLSTFILTLVSSKENPYHVNTIFMIFPQFCFGKSLINMALEDIRSQSLENFGVKSKKNSFAWNMTMKYIVIMLVMGTLFFVLTILIEYDIFQRFLIDKLLRRFSKRKRKSINKLEKDEEDEDVEKERERVLSGKAKEAGDVLVINNLTKVYPREETPAVDHICVGVKHGECFGLLGLNGAGKTTVFKMLTGSISPTEGDATVGGYSIRGYPNQTKLLIGYCPQINALDPYLTADEHLSFFCRIRGLTGPEKEREVTSKIERLGLTDQRNKLVKQLSGGNKRKVNTAIALVCEPELVLLDEPTTGMDALSRRFLWNCLQEVVLEGHCVILTSHSMEECEALCTHLSIMVNGRFTCFGSTQHLKNKFSEGYSVTVRLFSPKSTEDAILFFEKNLPGSTLVHAHHLQVKYKLNPNIFIGSVFPILSQAKEQKLIQDYSISQTTLESIFLRLAVHAEYVKKSRTKCTFIRNFCSGLCKKKAKTEDLES